MTAAAGKFRKNQAADSTEPPPPTVSRFACVAHGCPLPGVFGFGQNGSICLIHDSLEGFEWPAATNRIRAHLTSFDLATRLVNSPPGEEADDEDRRQVALAGFDLSNRRYKRELGYGLRTSLLDFLRRPSV